MIEDNYVSGILVNHTCENAIILENHRWFEKVADEYGADRIRYWCLDHELLLMGNILVAVAQGASIVASLAERLRVSGASNIIRIATTGGLQSNIDIGDIILPYTSIRDEGTSVHYISPEIPVVGTMELLDRLSNKLLAETLTLHKGMVWTTDGRWMESDEKIARYKHCCCLAVDMETAGLYSVGMFRHIGVASINIVTDLPFNDLGQTYKGSTAESLWSERVMPVFTKVFEATLSVLNNTTSTHLNVI